MLQALKTGWTDFRETISAIPDIVFAGILAVIAIAIALVVHGIVAALLRRLLFSRHPYLHSWAVQLKGPFRFALMLLALDIAVAAAPLDQQFGGALSAILRICFIGMVGWITLAATNIGAALYLRRFNLEAEDNLLARKHVTQVRVLKGTLNTVIVVLTIGIALMSFDSVRQLGVSLFASAGIAGIAVGLAARPMLSNLIAGVQLAITQPIRIEDAVVVENEMGFIEEITATYVVVRLWDWRRLVVPLSYFIEKPFQNWTRETAALIGTVMIHADYSVPLEPVRAKLDEIVKASNLWDGRVLKLQVWEADANALQLRVLVSARNASALSDLRCEVREKLIGWLQTEHPRALPRSRQEAVVGPGDTEISKLENRRPHAVS